MYSMFAEVMDSLGADWRKKVIGISIDGANDMTGCHLGVATRIWPDALPGLYRVWCGSHQLNLVV